MVEYNLGGVLHIIHVHVIVVSDTSCEGFKIGLYMYVDESTCSTLYMYI